MGKRYYCDFCNKTMVATPSVIKTHNKGVGHQKLVQEYYQQYKDPEVILSEECRKTPCSRFSSGNCPFGSICRFSHYSREEIEELRKFVAEKNIRQSDANQPSFEDLYHKLQDKKSKRSDNDNTVLYDKNGVTHVFPWIYNPIFDSFHDTLPPSLKRMKIEDFVTAEVSLITNGNCDLNTNIIKILSLLNTNNNDEGLSQEINIIIPKSNDDHFSTDQEIGYEDEGMMTVGEDNLKPILRGGGDETKIDNSKTEKLLKYQHRKKLKELIDFLRDNYSSTNYLHSEMLRIKRQYQIEDKMREMIDYLEEPQHFTVKDKILKIFDRLKRKKDEELSLWNLKTNDLVINIIKDPNNDGVAN